MTFRVFQTRFENPDKIDDATQVYGDNEFDCLDLDDISDCDHQGVMAECGIVRCAFCGRRMG